MSNHNFKEITIDGEKVLKLMKTNLKVKASTFQTRGNHIPNWSDNIAENT